MRLLLLQLMLLLLLGYRVAGLQFIAPPGPNNADTQTTTYQEENAPVGTVIYTIRSDTACVFSVSDTGGGTACTSTEVRVEPSAGLVTTAELKVNSLLNYETRTVYSCEVLCNPTAGAAQTATITLSLSNVNDETPTPSTTSVTSEVQEEQASGATVNDGTTTTPVSVRFTDSEVTSSGDTVTCRLSGPGATLFSVTSTPETDGVTCTIRTALRIDRDTLTSDDYPSLQLIGTDSGGLSSITTLSISITDINDNAPTCTNAQFSASVKENVASATLATIATCSDIDKGVNADLVYAMLGSPAGFTLAANVLSLSAAKDYDTMATNPEIIYVTVADSAAVAANRKTITTTVTVSILPVNDNTPTLTTASLTTTVPESTSIGVAVLTPTATDADKSGGPDSSLSWTIVSAISTAGTNIGLNLANSFSIDSSSGAVSIGTAGLDFESWTEGKVVVKVTDAGSDPSALSATQTLTITVTDINELPPTFSPSSYYRVSLAENNVENFTVLSTFSVTDPDSSALPVWCEIISGNVDSVFRFNETNRNILELAKTIEPDSATNHPLLFMLVVECKDNNGTSPFKSSSATIQVDITTSNDLNPVITSTSGCTAGAPCSESTTLSGTTVATLNAYDNDIGSDGDFTCSIKSPAGAPFTLQGCTALVLSGPLDYETATSYSVVVEARDRGTPSRAGTTTIDIRVGDVDDNAPYCLTYDYSFTVGENAAGNDVVGFVNCLDSDAAGVVYTLVPATVPFTVSPAGNRARIRVNNPSTLDYESTTAYEFTVRTSDSGTLARSTDAIVRVQILPHNEQTPTFADTAISVDETQSAGSVVTTFAAADSDTGGHGIVSYSIQSATNSGQTFFSISNSGQVSLIKGLDYETTQQYVLTVTATDGGGLVGTGTLTINIADKNDNSPICAATQVSLTMAETATATTVATGTPPTAADADSPAVFGKIKYSISAGDTGSYFTINAATAAISRSSTAGLSYESLTPPYNYYNLTVLAIDENGLGPNTATCLAKVTITDVEEGAPVFSPSIASATALAESTAVGTVVYTPTYTHVDKWDIPTFTLNPVNALFSVEESTGKISLAANLDYETATQHVLYIVATDKNSQTSTMTLTVPVTNDNEFSPVCAPSSTTVYIDENDQTGSPFPKNVIAYSCSDGDAGTTLLYTVTNVDGVATTGDYQFISNQLRTTAALNYEAPNTNDILFITISDQGPATANILTVTLTVSINPVNEYAPVFTASSLTPAAADENVAVGTSVATLIATDTDTGSDHTTIKYAITSGNDKAYFSLDESTGAVTAAKLLDREDAATYLLTVTATDGPGLAATSTLTISLNDINDNSPAFTQTVYAVNVNENAGVGFTILSFTGKVSDADATSPNNQVILSIQTTGTPFAFNAADVTGRDLQVNGALNAATNPSYTLTIRGTDKNGAAVADRLTTDIQVIVTVLPVNLAAPTFSGSTTENVDENTAVGTVISTATATDTDSGLAGNITYSFGTGNTNGDFIITPTDGRITLKNALDFDAGTKVYYLGVVATDSGTPAKSTSWTLTVSVTDVNDNAPIWSASNNYSQVLAEDTAGPLPKSVYTLLVSDPDSGVNGNVVYSLVSQSGTAPDGTSPLFGVDSSSGAVRLLLQPDREFASSYNLVIKACDGGSPALCSQKLFVYTIGDANDNTPTFGLCPKEITIAENTGGNVLIQTIAATDADANANGQISAYALVSADGGASSPAGLFTVSATGGITTDAGLVSAPSASASLNRETRSVYQFYLTAADNGSPSRLTGSCLVNVSITDKNDNAPVIGGQPIITSVSEGAAGGTIFYTLATTDADIGKNADFLFDVSAFTPANNFTINNKGQLSIFTGQNLDRERHAAYNLTIRVRDQGTDPGQQTSTATVSINVNDINDNSPTFGANSIGRSVAENSAVNTTVGAVVAATDADLGENASITYRLDAILVPTSGGDYFSIAPLTGQITVKQALLDRETRDLYVIRLMAVDNGSPALSGTTTVTITITDVNDNTPAFTGTYTSGVSVNENSAAGTFVHHLAASDADTGVNAQLSYAIDLTRLNGTLVNTYFQINATGHLTVKAPIDRETYSQLQFYVLAEDSGSPVLTGSASVNIFINDVNDNAPVFDSSFYNTEMYYKENRTSITLTKVTARDSDATSNSILYGWGVSSTNFVMNRVNGIVSPGAQQATVKDTLYVQLATAADSASPSLTSTATVRIDTYDITEVGVCITYSTIISNFVARQSAIEASLGTTLHFRYPTIRCETWRFSASSGTVWACHYCVQDNSTDSTANIAAPKAFVPQTELLTFWRLNTNGDPTAMLQTTNFSGTPITLVEGYTESSSTTTSVPWYQTPWGIAVIVLSSVLALSLLALAIGGLVYYCMNRSPTVQISKSQSVPRTVQSRPHPQAPKKSVANNNKNVYRDTKLWRGTPEFGRYQNSPGEVQRTGRAAGNSWNSPTPVS